MVQFIILDQLPPNNIKSNLNIIQNTQLWNKYLDELCALRGRVYIEEGLYSQKILTADGKFEEKWDPISLHTIAIDGENVVGGVRVTLLSENGNYYDGEIDHFLKKLSLPKHADTFYSMLHNLGNKKRKIVEVSRLIVAEEYRRFRDPNSIVSLGLFTLTYSYAFENRINDAFIIQGNKYKTGRIYERLGFSYLQNRETNKPLEPFFEFDDICSLMYIDLSEPSDMFFKFINDMKHVYLKTPIIVKESI